jgi:uncharacterized protein YbcI
LVTDSKQRTGELLAEISNMVVGVYADCLGRGPTRARSYIDHDVILCLLEDTLTKPERQLISSGNTARLLELRAMLQATMEEPLVTGMERLMGRRVKAVISGRQIEPDVVTEVFILGEALEEPSAPAEETSSLLPGSGKEGGTLQKEQS